MPAYGCLQRHLEQERKKLLYSHKLLVLFFFNLKRYIYSHIIFWGQGTSHNKVNKQLVRVSFLLSVTIWVPGIEHGWSDLVASPFTHGTVSLARAASVLISLWNPFPIAQE